MDAVTNPATPDPAAAAAAAANAAATDPAATPPVADPAAPAPAAPASNDGRTPGSPPQWMLDRIARETRKREEVERAAADQIATLQARLREAEGRGSQNPPAAVPAAQQPTPAQPDLSAAINQAADAKLLNQARLDIIKAGHSAFGAQKFDQECNILAAVDCVNDAFISDVIAVDRTNAHKLLSTLASQPETAARLSQLDSRSRIAELTRMSMAAPAPANPAPGAPPANPAAPAAPAARAVSRAPAPPPPVDPSASKVVDWRTDDASDEEFHRGFVENQERRFKQRMGR